MDDILLGPDNIRLLGSLPALDLIECATRLSESVTNNRHTLTLQVYATLQRLQTSDTVIDPDLPRLVELLTKGLSIFPAEYDGSTDPKSYSDCSLLAEASLATLVLLSRLDDASPPLVSLSYQHLLSILPYTDGQDPWVTAQSSGCAEILLSRYLTDDRHADVVIKSLLQDTIRPLFSRPSTRLTASGRPSKFTQQPDVHRNIQESSSSWKENASYVISSFRFALKSSPALVATHWPLFLPVVVSLAEDETAFIREKGLVFMDMFLDSCPPHLIRSTGVGDVFRDAVFPTLLFLPSLTPEQDSIKLLPPAYRVLLKLARLELASSNSNRQKLLDKLMRDGVMAGFAHASQHIHIVHVLMDSARDIVDCMDVYAVKHLQDLLPLFSSVLTDPFAILYPPAVISAVEALETTLMKCWPRLFKPAYMELIINAIARCWLNVDDEMAASKLSHHDRDEICRHLVRVSRILRSLWKQQGCDPPDRLRNIIIGEPRLAGLLLLLGEG